jgi:hypothetical protein
MMAKPRRPRRPKTVAAPPKAVLEAASEVNQADKACAPRPFTMAEILRGYGHVPEHTT